MTNALQCVLSDRLFRKWIGHNTCSSISKARKISASIPREIKSSARAWIASRFLARILRTASSSRFTLTQSKVFVQLLEILNVRPGRVANVHQCDGWLRRAHESYRLVRQGHLKSVQRPHIQAQILSVNYEAGVLVCNVRNDLNQPLQQFLEPLLTHRCTDRFYPESLHDGVILASQPLSRCQREKCFQQSSEYHINP